MTPELIFYSVLFLMYFGQGFLVAFVMIVDNHYDFKRFTTSKKVKSILLSILWSPVGLPLFGLGLLLTMIVKGIDEAMKALGIPRQPILTWLDHTFKLNRYI